MPDSPKLKGDSTIKVTLTINGKAMDDTWQILSIRSEKAVNKIPWAHIELADGDMPNGDFPLSSADAFVPGATICINAGYGQQVDTLFKGVVVRHGIQIAGDNQSRLRIECRDATVKMTVGRKNANFINKKDSDVLSQLIGQYGDLSAAVTATQQTLDELVQFYCTDWDFLVARAEVNGLLVMVDDSQVTVAPPDVNAAAKLSVTYGQDLMELQADMDARAQYSSVTATAWDLGNQKMIEAESGSKTLNPQGNLTAGDLSAVIGLSAYRLQTSIPMAQERVKAWTDAQQVKSGLARIRGRMTFQGNAKIKPGDLVELTGAGDRFSGPVFATAVIHTIAQGDWTTTVCFGLSPEWFVEARNTQPPMAAGMLPGVEGLQIGVVVQIHEDPAGQYRVKVNVPVLQADTEGVWARLASPYASEGFGWCFFPEIGDEVVLGYFNNDPCHPVVIGALYSSNRKAPLLPAEKNNNKTLMTRSQLELSFDEEKKSITITTAAGNRITLSDEDKSITVTDQNDNTVSLESDGISLNSPKNITIKASGNISIQADAQIDVTAKTNIQLSGMNIDNKADVGFTAKGNATAEVSASGQTTVKGAMVMIN